MNELLQLQQQLLQQEQQQQSQLAVKIDKVDKQDGRPDKHRIVSEILNDIIENVVVRVIDVTIYNPKLIYLQSNEVAISGPGKEGIIVEDINFSDFCMIFAYVCQVAAEQPKRFPILFILSLFYYITYEIK